MKQLNLTRVAIAGLLAASLLALGGCAAQGGTNDAAADADGAASAQADAENRSQQNDQNQVPSDAEESTAMVAYVNGDQVLFVDQETQTPYIPTNIDDAKIIYDGQEIDEDNLVAGNIVKVTGNGVMAESYPGQYPGIYQIEVVEQGSPADAEQYAEIVDTVFAAPDQSQVPSGSLEYKTPDTQVSVILNPYEFEWQWKTDDGQTSTTEVDGFAADGNGVFSENVIDTRVASATDAFIAFSVNPTSVEIERTPLAKDSQPQIDPASEDADVPSTLGEDGAIALSIEPNYLYEVKVTFPQGEAAYAFYTLG
ncbi:hypothetical protein AALA69_01305 [Eggerthellaceae bacterium 24-137]